MGFAPVHPIADKHALCRLQIHFFFPLLLRRNSVRLANVFPSYIHCIAKSQERGRGTVTKKGEKKKKIKKDSQLVLRLDKEERDAFVKLCNELDTSAAREIRGFIRTFLKEHRAE